MAHPAQKDARFYHEHSQLQHHIAVTFLGHVHFHGFEKVLEIGCADGQLAAEISSLVPQGTVLGIDSSEQMIVFAKSQFPQQEHHNLSFQRADFTQLSFQQEFDIVLSFFALEWSKDLLTALKHLYNSLKPGGKARLLIAMRDPLQDDIRALAQEARWKSRFHDSSLLFEPHANDHYQALLQQAHFNEHVVKEEAMNWIFHNKDEFTSWLMGWLTFSDQFPPEEQRLFCQEVVQRYVDKIHPPHEKGIMIPFNVLWATAEKEKIHLTTAL